MYNYHCLTHLKKLCTMCASNRYTHMYEYESRIFLVRKEILHLCQVYVRLYFYFRFVQQKTAL